MSKRILIDSTNVNITQPGGGSFCTQAYIEAFLTLFPDRVDILHPEEAHIRDKRYTTIDVPARPVTQAAIGAIKGYFHRAASFLVDYIQNHPEKYDTVVISTGLFAGGIVHRFHQMHIRVIVLHHNFEPEYRLDSRSILTLKGKTDKIVRYWEKKGYLQADINFFLTFQDMTRFEQEYGKHPHNYMTGVFEPTYDRSKLSFSPQTDSAVITCALCDTQNEGPLLRFAEKYLPVFRKELPTWHIELMGRKPTSIITSMAADDEVIHLTPDPIDIRNLAAQSKIYLCPMDAGGGLKLRIMDGLRAGQPVLAHTRAARGYDQFIDMPFFRTYNDEDSFREGLRAINRYIHSIDYSREAVQNQYYCYFSLESGVKRLEAILCK